MILKKILVGAVVGSALALGGVGLTGGVANAHPIAPAPLKPGHDDPCPPPWCNDRGHDNGWHNGWDKGQWWASNRHDWWDDRNGQPPWGWGPPPAAQWYGAPPWVDPHPINYWGWNANPVWDDNFHAWGIWVLGVWIPLIGIGVT